MSFIIWNVAGAYSLDEDTWSEIKKYEVIGLVETWIEEGKERLIKEKLKGYKCFFNEARREKKKGRAKGGMVVAVKKCDEIKEVKFKKVNEECTKVEFKIDGKEWLIAVVYMRESRRQVWASLKEETEYVPGKHLMIGGDFNSRIGEKGGRKTDVDEEERRSSKDKMCNEEGNEMLKWMEEAGMHVLNGNIEGDERGEYTYVGVQGCTVIDYILVNEECREEVKEMTIGRSINSDHLPMQIN